MKGYQQREQAVTKFFGDFFNTQLLNLNEMAGLF